MRLLRYVFSYIAITILLCLALVCDIPAMLAELSVWIQRKAINIHCWNKGHSYDIFGTLLSPVKEVRCLDCNNLAPLKEHGLIEAQRQAIAETLRPLANHLTPSELAEKLS